MPIHLFQLATSGSWFVAALILVPGTYRAFFSTLKPGDPWKAALFFVSMIFVGGSSRFLIAPDNLFTWKMLYVMSVLLALYVYVIVWNTRRDNA